MEDGRRRLRTRVSAALLALGTAAFAVSLALPAVRRRHDSGRPISLEGWTCATHHAPTFASNAFLDTAFLFWAGAVWFRSVWCWWIGVVASALAVVVHAFVGAWPGYEGIERLGPGYWTWLGATALVAGAFAALPKPVRPAPGERLAQAERDRGRRGIAVTAGAFAAVVLLGTHLFVPVPVGETMRPGEEPPGSFRGWYQIGPTRSSYGRTETPQPDGTVLVEHVEFEMEPPATVQFRAPHTAALEFGMLATVLVFAAASSTLRAGWRWTGAALGAAAALVAGFVVETPWPTSGVGTHPLDIGWWLAPALLAAACLLLPPRRTVSA